MNMYPWLRTSRPGLESNKFVFCLFFFFYYLFLGWFICFRFKCQYFTDERKKHTHTHIRMQFAFVTGKQKFIKSTINIITGDRFDNVNKQIESRPLWMRQSPTTCNLINYLRMLFDDVEFKRKKRKKLNWINFDWNSLNRICEMMTDQSID